ncbi:MULTISPECIES: hypothetical protein [unclassified Bacillus (in: firmicutes)]|nr:MULTISPECIES: hypothetical protein [unclassified Bacillus (in: firmicutes)]SFA92091.1 hypothetical protein SAMN02799634_102632 [Bacillus sp. UNCCL13]SFQ85788.1 hypothetical protein SAMN04488577_2750 [Bacillus sp. cl95]
MTKFTFEDELWAVKEYEKETLSFRDIGKQLGNEKRRALIIWLWIRGD